jgi:protein-L-isoaspartate(D-aspartate) O-methyltransferase
MRTPVPNTDHLTMIRRAFATQMLGNMGVVNERLHAALASVPREVFLGQAPWSILKVPGGSQTLPSNDPIYAYQDVLFALSPERGVNNGSPSLHARMLHEL